MQNVIKLQDDLMYVGVSDRKLKLFENIYPVERGVTYNSYVLLDERTVLLDTADAGVSGQFMENVTGALNGRKLDYVIVNHVEPDHVALIEEVLLRWPEAVVVTNAKAAGMIGQFFENLLDGRLQVVKEGDVLETGHHELTFVMAPMVHWPEVMVTFDKSSGTLFSADAFGTFGALSGHVFADEYDFERDWLADARRYLVNIVGKYGPQVQMLLKKASGLDIKMICPLHGPVWRKNLGWFIEKYDRWSRYEAEERGVLVVYGSIYGHTASAAERLARMLAERGVEKIAVWDASGTDVSVLVAEAFRWSHWILASSTYNNGIFTPMENFLMDLKAHNMQNRTVAVVENGSWAPVSGKLMRGHLGEMKGMEVLEESVTIKSSLKESQVPDLERVAAAIAESMMGK